MRREVIRYPKTIPMGAPIWTIEIIIAFPLLGPNKSTQTGKNT